MLKFHPKRTLLAFLCLALTHCQTDKEQQNNKTEASPLFNLLSPKKTNITFENHLTEGLNTNVLMYEYFYNGGGVAIGDLNGDNLDDIYFTANMGSNKLYLNKGNLTFEDITEIAGVAGRKGPWKTGVTFADVNGDGLLDMYVCYSGNLSPAKRKNELYINEGTNQEGIPQFSEQAEKYGIASTSTSTQATFFDYDNDGDLDLFLLNHNPKSLPILDESSTAEILKSTDPAGSQLFRNDNGQFKEVTKEAGIQNSALSYGLGAGVADVNGDGWMDIYVCNDYTVPDYLYINNQDGTFTDQIKSNMGHTSHFSMGNDVADINNDGYLDILSLDMLPEENRRQKLLMAPDNYEKYDFTVKVGFHHQNMRNMLHLNNGNGTYSEIGQLAGISNTDWSWAALLADFDNDGWKDLYITNGYLRDYTNLDFLKYMGDYIQNHDGNIRRQNVLELVQKIPSSNLQNYTYKNLQNLTFENSGVNWGLNHHSNSNGAAYADLDNDGDLELIVNNINQPAFIFENRANQQLDHQFLQVQLKGNAPNTLGLGAKITLHQNGLKQYQEQMPTRGYQSSVSPTLHFGLGNNSNIDSLHVVWPSGKEQWLKNIEPNQKLVLEEDQAQNKYQPTQGPSPLFSPISSPIDVQIAANRINDFKRQPLLVNPISFHGPIMAKTDINGDGKEDVYLGGGQGEPGTLFIQQANGRFMKKNIPAFESDKAHEDTDAIFLDANGDGHIDLYVCSGGYANFTSEDPRLQDRLYINDGKGNFTSSKNALPNMATSSGTVAATDINGDGLPDLFVGGRVIPGAYPVTPKSYILINQGDGLFKDQTADLGQELTELGMITAATWVDINADGSKELIVVGEWMPISIFSIANGKLINTTADYFEKHYHGWWNTLLVEDFDGDGQVDIIAGNQGTNTQVQVSEAEPADMIYKDFDNNGSIDPILCFYIQGKSYPYVTRDELLDQMAMTRTRFPNYNSYADATLEDIFTPKEMEGAQRLKANYLKTVLFKGSSTGKFQEQDLPLQVQSSPVMAISSLDYDGDGNKDLIFCGNIQNSRLRFGKYDANYGILLKGDGEGNFSYIPQNLSGFQLQGDVRSILKLNNKLLFGINQKGIVAYEYSR